MKNEPPKENKNGCGRFVQRQWPNSGYKWWWKKHQWKERKEISFEKPSKSKGLGDRLGRGWRRKVRRMMPRFLTLVPFSELWNTERRLAEWEPQISFKHIGFKLPARPPSWACNYICMLPSITLEPSPFSPHIARLICLKYKSDYLTPSPKPLKPFTAFSTASTRLCLPHKAIYPMPRSLLVSSSSPSFPVRQSHWTS